MHIRSSVLLGAWCVLCGAAPLAAQSLPVSSSDGRRHLTAVELTKPIVIDGTLDDEVWQRAQPAVGFVQSEPREGQPATEATEVRLAFDHDALYVGILCRDSDPAHIVVNDIHKDFVPEEQDGVAVLLDTFADRRNGVVFYTNPIGAKADTQIANEGREANTSWDAVWTVQARRSSEGWTAEMRIPFKTLRFERGTDRIWGVNFARRIRRKNEIAYWSPVPRAYTIYRASQAGTLDGLPDVSQGRNLRIKPYALAAGVRGLGEESFDRQGKVGVDLKYGVTPSLTLDVTVNPDFAQAEADEQQVNLTQFSLFYPEKREFFLENSGIFYFGDIPRNQRTQTRFRPPEEDILLFFSRRIGLSAAGQQIPIRAGARMTGSAGGVGIGGLTIQTGKNGDLPSTNYTVIRARRNLFASSDVGAIFLSRQGATRGSDRNRVVGLDANFRFYKGLSVNSFLARSDTPGVGRGQWAGKAAVGWEDNFVHTQYSYLTIGDAFRDDIGFVRRTGIQKHFVDFGIRPRPALLRRYGLRELHPHLRINYFADQSGLKVTRNDHFAHTVYFEKGGSFEFAVQPRFERIATPFRMRPSVTIPIGGYGWTEYVFVLETDRSKLLSLSARVTTGGFWSGHQVSPLVSVLVRPSYRVQMELGVQRSDVTLKVPDARFTTELVTVRGSYAFNTKMFIDALVQYNTDVKQVSANVRFNLIHRPLSDLFVVYNEQQWTDNRSPAGRSLTVKYTHMLAF